MPNTSKINSEMVEFNNRYDKIKEFMDTRLTEHLDGPVLDKVGKKVEKLFEDATAMFARTPEMTPAQQIAFLTELRKQCVALGNLQQFLIKYVENKVNTLERPLEQTMKVAAETQEMSAPQESNVIEFPQQEQGRTLSLTKAA